MDILIVDDDKVSRTYLLHYLKGHKISEAKDGLEGLEVFREKEYDLIFMNVQMPILNGIQVTNEIKKYRPDVPVVGYSTQDPNRLPKIFDDYIRKPANKEEIYKVINKYL